METNKNSAWLYQTKTKQKEKKTNQEGDVLCIQKISVWMKHMHGKLIFHRMLCKQS